MRHLLRIRRSSVRGFSSRILPLKMRPQPLLSKDISNPARDELSSSAMYSSFVRRDQFPMPPGVTESGINRESDSDPNQHRAGLIPCPKPPGRSFIRVTQFMKRKQREKEDYSHDLPGCF